MLPSQQAQICMAVLGTDGFDDDADDETANLGNDDDKDATANVMGQEHVLSVFARSKV